MTGREERERESWSEGCVGVGLAVVLVSFLD